MTIEMYEKMKEKYENTKPIRGRSEDIRPIGDRRKQNETIVKREYQVVPGEFVTAYAARLYVTDVVTYFPDGTIYLNHGGYTTPTTAYFMHNHSPKNPFFNVSRAGNKLWVKLVPDLVYPASLFVLRTDRTPNIFVPTGERDTPYKFINPPKLFKRGVDRKATAALRKRIKPFMDYAETILKLSGGWVSNASVKEAMEKHPNYGFTGVVEFVQAMENGDTDLWTRALHAELRSCQPAEWDAEKIQYKIGAFRRRINAMLTIHPGAVTTTPVPTNEYGAVEKFDRDLIVSHS